MAATEEFTAPAYGNAIDDDLDSMRNSLHFLLLAVVKGNVIIPGWNTRYVTTTNNYARPDYVLLTRSGRQIKLELGWNTDGTVAYVTYCYHDGFNGWVCFDRIGLYYIGGEFVGTTLLSANVLFDSAFAKDEYGDQDWLNNVNVLTEGGTPDYYFWNKSEENYSDGVRLGDADTSISATAVVTWIRVEMQTWYTQDLGQGDIVISELTIGGATGVERVVPKGTSYTSQDPLVWEGDLTYWNRTNTQARNFLRSASSDEMYYSAYCYGTNRISGGPLYVYVDNLKISCHYYVP